MLLQLVYFINFETSLNVNKLNMSKVISFLLLLFFCGFLFAQDNVKDTITKKYVYHYSVNNEALSSIDRSMLSDHPFGENIARKIQLLQDYYTYIEPPSPF